MSSIRETLIKTANSYIEGFNTNTAEGVIACRTPDCKQVICPSSVPPPWYSPPRSNEEYQAFVVPGFKMLRNVKISLVEGEDMLVDETSHKVLLHLKSTGETDFGPYANEYMIVLKMTEDGTQIKEIVEFIDSATTRDIAQAMAQGQPKPE
jgi:ketosteroid isomerase-like protein